MSKFADELMNKLKNENIKPLPKSFFVLVKAFFEVCLVGLVVLVIFLINLSFYLPRRGMGRGGFGPGRLDLLISSVPWHFVLVGILGLALIIWMIYRYTGAYKTKLIVVIGAISIGIFLLGFILSLSNVNQHFEGRREFRQFYPENRQDMKPRGQNGPGFLR